MISCGVLHPPFWDGFEKVFIYEMTLVRVLFQHVSSNLKMEVTRSFGIFKYVQCRFHSPFPEFCLDKNSDSFQIRRHFLRDQTNGQHAIPLIRGKRPTIFVPRLAKTPHDDVIHKFNIHKFKLDRPNLYAKIDDETEGSILPRQQ